MKPKDKKTRVLLIDDDPEDLALLEEFLFRMNGKAIQFALETAKNLQDGLKCLKKGETDIVLLDLLLPDSKGIETFLKVSRATPEVPVIIMSVHYDDGLAIEAVRRGAQDYLFKKETGHDLLVRTIRFAIERHRLKLELSKANTRLEKLALVDPITELFNRRGLQEILTHEVDRSQKKHSNLLVLLVDLDDFKKINNILGHSVGDVVLKEVASKLRSCLRPTDYAGRVGGDEFMVFLPETRFAEGLRLAEKLRLAIATTIVSISSANDVKVTASLGLINLSSMSIQDSSDSMEDMISKIHILLHKNKQSAKNRVSFDEDEVYYDSLSEIPELLADSEQYRVMLQPIVDLSLCEAIGYEFLSRSSIKGFEMPDDFFRAALEANMLVKVDYECFKLAVQEASKLDANLCAHLNLYPSTMINLPTKNLIELLDKKRKGFYCVEISEQQIIGDPSYLVESVTALKRAGVKIAIDDLGFGRSCLESLILLEPNIVKIDKKCVTGISHQDNAALRSLKRLLKMAKSLGAEVIAEGIETRQDFDLVKSLGVKYAQGYFLGKPKSEKLKQLTLDLDKNRKF